MNGERLAIVAAYFLESGVLDTLSMLLAIVGCVVSCFIGMKNNSQLSAFTNLAKLICYPICLVVALGLSAVNVFYWNS